MNIQVLSDQHLLNYYRSGDQSVISKLIERHKRRDRDYIYMMVKDNDVADDIFQETFIKVYIYIHRYTTAYTFGQCVYTFARNTFVDFIRRRQEDLPIDDKFTAPPSNNPTPEENIIRKQQRTQIERYLQAMPPRYRQLIVMRFFEEYSYEEIAMKLELPLGTVKTQIHRAREQMCRLIAADEKS